MKLFNFTPVEWIVTRLLLITLPIVSFRYFLLFFNSIDNGKSNYIFIRTKPIYEILKSNSKNSHHFAHSVLHSITSVYNCMLRRRQRWWWIVDTCRLKAIIMITLSIVLQINISIKHIIVAYITHTHCVCLWK